MQRKDYITVAYAIKEIFQKLTLNDTQKKIIIETFSTELDATNANFDWEKFQKAILK